MKPHQIKLSNCNLICTVGLPYSGKSTWAKQHIDKAVIVNVDCVRVALYGERYIASGESMVWSMTQYMVKSLFLAGHSNVILDCTNITNASRRKWISNDWNTYFVHFETSRDRCVDRATKDNDWYIVKIIDDMNARFETFEDGQKVLSPNFNWSLI